MKAKILLVLLFFSGLNLFGSEDGEIGFGLNFPLVKDKFYISAEADLYYKVAGIYFDLGFMVNDKELEEFDNKQLLGWFTNFEVFKKLDMRDNFSFKLGLGLSYHNLANIDSKKWYLAMPFSATIEYKIKQSRLFYRVQVPLIKSDDMEYSEDFVGNIGIGVCF